MATTEPTEWEGYRSGGGAVMCFQSNPKFLNCTIVGNYGYGLIDYGRAGCYAITVTNSILWDNVGYQAMVCGPQSRISYSAIQGGLISDGNINEEPYFAEPGYWDPNDTPEDPNDDFWINGDYHLKSQIGRWDPVSESWVQDDFTSPCIDAGDPNSLVGDEPQPNGGIINMGAYGGTAEASLIFPM